jgi:hypothetical protein
MSEVALPHSREYHGDALYTPLLQVGMRTDSDGYGFVTTTLTLVRNDDRGEDGTITELMATPLPKPGEFHRGAWVHKLSRVYTKGKMETTTVELVSIDNPESQNKRSEVVVEGAATLSTEPIQTHPAFSEIAGSYKDPLNGSRWNPKDNSFACFVDPTAKEVADGKAKLTDLGRVGNLVGVKSFYSPQVVVRGHYFEQNDEGEELAIAKKVTTYSKDGKFGEIQLVPEQFVNSYPNEETFEAEGTVERSWLLSSLNFERYAKGRIIKVSFECILSGVFGWHPKIYKEETEVV